MTEQRIAIGQTWRCHIADHYSQDFVVAYTSNEVVVMRETVSASDGAWTPASVRKQMSLVSEPLPEPHAPGCCCGAC